MHTVTVLDQTTDAVEIVKFDFNEDGTVDSSAERFRLASSLDAGSSSTNTIIIGTDGSDEIGGSNFNDVIFGYGGDDVISGRRGDDRIDGGLGNDTVSFSDLSDGINIDLNDGSASGTTAGSDTLINVENVIGSAGADIITGDNQNNILAGGAGNDVVSGGAGDDQLTGGAGTDTISFVGDNSGVSVSLTDGTADGADSGSDELDGFENVIGGDGDDVIIGSDGANRLDGGAGNDLLTALGGDDEIIGGSGIDTANFDTLSDDVSVDLSSGTVSGVETGNDTISGVENIVTGDGSDTVLGDNSDNIIWTGRGADTIDGGQGDDTLDGAGNDTLSFGSDVAGVDVDLGAGTSEGTSGGPDQFTNFENVRGGSGNDRLLGDAKNNILTGEGGADELLGGGGDDTLRGNAGADILDGGEGDDVLTGGAGNDIYIVSDGNDTINAGQGSDILKVPSDYSITGIVLNSGSVGLGNLFN